LDKVDARMDKMQLETSGRIDRVQADLNTFYRDLGKQEAKTDNLEKRAS